MLAQDWQVRADKVSLIHEFIPCNAGTRTEKAEAGQRIRDQFGLPHDGVLILSCGSADWRKGADLFVQLARVVCQERPKRAIHFAWLGADPNSLDLVRLQYDVGKAGLHGRVSLLAPVPDPKPYFEAADVFALVSREDPFPLVMLEAASAGRPIVCFQDAGGAPEFVENDCGIVTPYLDMPAMARAICSLVDDEGLRLRLGKHAAEKVRQRHDINVAAPKILSIIRSLLE